MSVEDLMSSDPITVHTDATLREVMQTDVISVNAEADVGEVIEVMLDHKVGAVPVVDPGAEHLVGIVSYEDVLRAAQECF